MAIGVRDITNLEELLEVQDDDKIIVIQNGEAKLISKSNAKFGGGSATVFYTSNLSLGSGNQLFDMNNNAITAQQAYDAMMSGPVYVFIESTSAGSSITVSTIYGITNIKIYNSNESIVSVAFICITIENSGYYYFYAGEDPATLVVPS